MADVAMEQEPPSSALRKIVPLAVLLLTAGVYLPVLGFGFVGDDTGQIVQSQSRYTWSAVPSYFGSDVWGFIVTGKTDYYRPVFLLWMMLNSKIFGLNTALLHAAALGLHLLATLLVYFLALRLTRHALLSGAAALLFGIHPVHIEAVSWLSGVTESLFAVFALGAILCQLPENSRKTECGAFDSSCAPEVRAAPFARHGKRAGGLLLFAAALFAKETAAVLPLLLAACDWLFPSDAAATRRQRLGRALSTLGWCFGIGLIYMAARIHALGVFTPVTRRWTAPMMIWTLPSLLVFYLRQLLAPFEYSLFYPIYPIVHASIDHSSASRVAEPLLLIALVVALLLWLARQSKSLAFAALLLVVPIVPALNLNAFLFDNFAHDRYLYLPSVGLCLLGALLVAPWSNSRRWKAVTLATAFAAAVAWLGYVSLKNSSAWADDLSLFGHAVEVAPRSLIAKEYLANALLVQQRFADALPLYQEALLNGPPIDEPTNQLLYIPIGMCYVGLGQLDEAEGYLYRALSLDPAAHVARYYLALIEQRRGRLPEAEAQAREALRLGPRAKPELSSYHGQLAQILEREGNLQGALAEYEAALREDPASTEGRSRLQDLEQRLRQ